MAAEMLEKILEAEKKSKEKIEQTRVEVDAIINKARDDGKLMVRNAVSEADKRRKQDIEACNDKAKKLVEEKLAVAKAVCEKMVDDCLKKRDVCTRIVIDELLS